MISELDQENCQNDLEEYKNESINDIKEKREQHLKNMARKEALLDQFQRIQNELPKEEKIIN